MVKRIQRKSRSGRKSRRVQKTRKQKQKQRQGQRRPTRKQRGGAFSIDSVGAEYENDTIVTIRPDSLEEDSIPMTMRLTTARKLLEDTDTGA
jgi:hypothetical protein